MWWGTVFSVSFHAAIILALVITWPKAEPLPYRESQIVPVDISRIAEQTNPPPGEREVSDDEEAAEAENRTRRPTGGERTQNPNRNQEDEADAAPERRQTAEADAQAQEEAQAEAEARARAEAEARARREAEERAAAEAREAAEAEERARREQAAREAEEERIRQERAAQEAERRRQQEEAERRERQRRQQAEARRREQEQEQAREQQRQRQRENNFSDVLRNVDEMRRDARRGSEERTARNTQQGDTENNRPGEPLTISEIDAVKRQIYRCWNFDSGLPNAETLRVTIRVWLTRAGAVQRLQIEDQGRMARDSAFRAAAESARRALLNPACSPLQLPPDKYDRWRVMVIEFDPAQRN